LLPPRSYRALYWLNPTESQEARRQKARKPGQIHFIQILLPRHRTKQTKIENRSGREIRKYSAQGL
jgi:hypothetical protein